MAKSPKLYGIYDKETNLVFCGSDEECMEFLEIGKNAFYVSISAMKKYPNRYSKKGYRIEIIGKLKDFEVEE